MEQEPLYKLFNLHLYKNSNPVIVTDANPDGLQSFSSVSESTLNNSIAPEEIQSGSIAGNLEYTGGYIQSANFISGTSGWKLDSNGTLTAVNAVLSGTITATAGAIGGFSIGSDYIRDVANSFGLASTVTGSDDVRGWAGATFANRTTAPFRYTEAGAVVLANVTIGGLLLTIDNTSDIQTSIDTLNAAGGGTLYLKSGTYTVTTALTGYSSITIIGVSPDETIINFSSTAANLSFAGTGVYTTGTITSITSGVNVTGSGTSWLANATAGQHLFLGTRWYLIAAVTGDTTLVLAEGYVDNVTMPGASYRIASVKQNIKISDLSIKNSTGTGLTFTDCRKLTLNNVLFVSNNKGIALTNTSECGADNIVVVTSTSNGVELTNVGLSDFESINSISNGGSGFVFNNIKAVTFYPCSATANTADGFNITTGVNLDLVIEASGNGGQGVECVSACSDIVMQTIAKGNTSDGIKLTATSDNCKIANGDIQSNGGYGVNIAASTCDNNIITGNAILLNTSGQINDSGTGTLIRGNIGAYDNSISGQSTFGGDGSDGALSVSSGATDIDLGGEQIVVKNYTSISITGTGSVTFSNPHSNGTLVIFKSQGNVTLTSSATPMIDLRLIGANVATAGITWFGSNSTGGGTATATLSGAAGGTQATAYFNTLMAYTGTKYFSVGSGSGTGSDGLTGSPAGAGGVGRRGGGAMILECNGNWNFTTSNGISVAGTNGENGASGTGAGAGGGGGGGGSAAGSFLAIYRTLTANSGTVNVSGSTGGTGGVGIAGALGTGGGGGGGGANHIGVGTNGTNGANGTNGGTSGNGGNGPSGSFSIIMI